MYFCEKDGKHNRVTVSRSFINEVVKFTEKRKSDYEYYVRAREGTFDQCVRQDWQAKVSEFALSLFLTDQYKFPFVSPDMNYYCVRDKSYAADLKYKNVLLFSQHYPQLNLHCKSCDIRTKEECGINGYDGESYAFCPLDDLFVSGGKSDWVACVFLPFEGIQTTAVEAYIRAIVPWDFISKENLWMPSKKEKFKSLKKFLYAGPLLDTLKLKTK
jgi:hypothetical protein